MSDKKEGRDDPKKEDGRGEKPKPTGSKEAEIIEKFKGYFHFDPKFLLSSAVQVPLRKTAEWLGKTLRKTVPSDSMWRGDITEFALYVAAAVVESPGSAILRTIGEFVAAFTQTFCGGEGEDDSGNGKKVDLKELPQELQTALAKAGAEIVADAAELIKATPPRGKEGMDEILVGRADSFWRVQERILNGPPKPEKTREPGVPFSEQLDHVGEAVERALKPLNEEIEAGVARLQAHNQELRNKRLETASPSKSPGAKFLRWLFK